VAAAERDVLVEEDRVRVGHRGPEEGPRVVRRRGDDDLQPRRPVEPGLGVLAVVRTGVTQASFLVLSGEKYVLIMPTTKTINTSNNNTFGTSKVKNLTASVKAEALPIGKKESTTMLMKGSRLK
jgi:hypothetical protein